MLSAAVANFLLFIASLGFGGALSRLYPRHAARWERAAFTVASGAGMMGTLLFLVGQFWFTRTAIAVILFAGIGLGAIEVARMVRGKRRTPLTRPPLIPIVIIGTVLLTTAIGGLADPTGDIQSDAIAYHFLGPKMWVRHGVIRPVPDETHTAFPALVETQYAAVYALGGDRAPELFSIVGLLAILLAAAALAQRSGLDRTGVWWTAALVAAMPVVHRGLYGGFVDAIYSTLVLAALLVGFDSERHTDSVLFGLLCGFAMGTKYTGVIAGAILIALSFAIIVVKRRRTIREAVIHVLIAGSVAAVIAAPWYIRNWVMLGTPIYPPPPLLSDWMAVPSMPPEAIRRFQDYVMGVQGMGRGIWNLLLLPFHLTMHPASFRNGDGGVGLTPLAFAPLGLLARRRDWFAASLSVFLILQTVAWFVTEQDARFLIPVFVGAAILAVWGWRYIADLQSRVATALAALVVATSVSYGVFIIASARKDDIHAVLSSSFSEERKRVEIPYRESFAYLNGDPSVTNVLVLHPRVPTFYLDRPYFKPVGRWGERSNAAEALPASHILDIRFEGAPFELASASPERMLVFERQDQRIYRVQTAPVTQRKPE